MTPDAASGHNRHVDTENDAVQTDSPDLENDEAEKAPARNTHKSSSLWRSEEAFRRYVGLGSKRSLTALAAQFGYDVQTVKQWSSRYEWGARLQVQSERETAIVLEAREGMTEEVSSLAAVVLQSGYALVYRRVQTLNDVARQIIDRLARDGVYEKRLVGIREVLLLRDKEVATLRALLSDIAEETGGRVRQVALLEEETIRQRILAEGLSPASAERIIARVREGKR